MEALLTTFLGAALAEFGDKTQLLVALLAVRYQRPGTILVAVALAAFANALIAAVGGALIHDFITLRAISLLVAVALLFAAVTGFIGQEPPTLSDKWKVGAFITAFVGFFAAEFGDKTQFLTGALAAQFDSVWLAAIGAAAGVTLANVPAALLAGQFGEIVPARRIRIGVSCLFLFIGFIVAISALRLI